MGVTDFDTKVAVVVRDDLEMWQRLNVTAGYTRDLTSGMGDSYTLTMDLRKYVTLVPEVTWANRILTQNSFGDDQERFYLGGPYNLRGWDRRSIYGTKTLLAQTEVRFPLLRRFQLGIPAPIEFPQVSVALFADAAMATNPGAPMRKIGDVGVGFFVGGGYFPVLRFDFVKLTNLVKIADHTRTQFSIGYNF